jgi:hypothetical protein
MSPTAEIASPTRTVLDRALSIVTDVRPGEGRSAEAVVVFIGTTLAFGVRHHAALNIALAIRWRALSLAIAREDRKLVPIEIGVRAA